MACRIPNLPNSVVHAVCIFAELIGQAFVGRPLSAPLSGSSALSATDWTLPWLRCRGFVVLGTINQPKLIQVNDHRVYPDPEGCRLENRMGKDKTY